MNEDQRLIRIMEEKAYRSEEESRLTSSFFLDLRQQSFLTSYFKNQPVHPILYGGRPDFERAILLFFPSYLADINTPEEAQEYFQINPQENPICLLRVHLSGKQILSHRDYLGSLMGLGIKREMIGDILPFENGCDIFILREMETFLSSHYDQAGRISFITEILDTSEAREPLIQRKEKRDTVASLRLDNIVSAAFSISRIKAVQAITENVVFVNGLLVEKPDKLLKPGDKIVLRGKGKVVLKELGGSTRKGRIPIILEQFI